MPLWAPPQGAWCGPEFFFGFGRSVERVWAPGNCLSMGGSKKNNARPVLAKCHKSNKTHRWTLKRLHENKSVYIVENDKPGQCLVVVGSRSRLVQSACKSMKKSHQWTLAGSKIYNKSAGKAIASKSTKAGSHPYLEKLSDSSKARGRQECGLS
ncbi:ricin-type beta-trefoil lectin domain protein [Streptomyces cyaneofuscatus]|uniref:ricin-type beta-trefoil lectin domain protein n=1 Tax=Streptomyces cyaneofuscatus TaxID=66883 RepID=UPI00364B3E86